MISAPLFIIVQYLKQPKGSTTENRLSVVYSLKGGHTAVKKRELHATAWWALRSNVEWKRKNPRRLQSAYYFNKSSKKHPKLNKISFMCLYIWDKTKPKIQRMIKRIWDSDSLWWERRSRTGNEEGAQRQIQVMECIVLWLSEGSWLFTILL